jgi:hypothetical protein
LRALGEGTPASRLEEDVGHVAWTIEHRTRNSMCG